ncbi:MAG: tetraacyldisaccharide 4'-kinase [Deltaproteobacteria bacterium]|nr:tetraacyldisaccharide 4'-kinase [Deltaproteobacteria bacterium]
MKNLVESMDWSKIHASDRFTPVTPLLAVCSLLYSAGVRLYHLAWRFRTRQALPGFTVSVGNLTVGGTGKTPATCLLAKWARDEGFEVAVLSRGYGGSHENNVLEVSDGDGIRAGPDEAGDEPYLMARRLKGVPVIVSRNRYDAGMLAHEKYGTNCFILDDGFQHIALERDLDLVLMDAARPLGNGFLLPRGPLREPEGYLKRAHAFVLTRCSGEGGAAEAEAMLGREFPGKPVFRSDHVPGKIIFPNRDNDEEPGFLQGKRVAAFAGIARPEVFQETLEGLGAEVVYFKGFKDHHFFTNSELKDLVTRKESSKADCLLTTEKDWVLSDRDAFFGLVKARMEVGKGNR